MDNCVVEIVQVRFVLRLELVEEVEQAEGKRGMWSNYGGREPSHFEELPTAVGEIPRVTLAVSDDNLVDAGEVENGKLMASRGMLAYFSERMTTQLYDKTERTKKIGIEVLTIPPLRVIRSQQGWLMVNWKKTYLNTMERESIM